MRAISPEVWIERTVTGYIKQALRDFPAVVLTGARQVGKTSLCRHIWPEANYITLDIPAHAEQARLTPEKFLEEHGSPLIIDEIQYAPELLRQLKISIDGNRRPGMYLITGSQDFLLMQRVSESLAGRCAVLTLPTLTLPEISAAGLITKNGDFDAFLWRGGWPELWRRPTMDRELWYGSYLATYLERDVRNLLNVGSLRDFDRFLRAAALRTGQLLSMAEMARDVGIAPNTAKSWLSLLQASHQILLLEPWHVNPGKRMIKAPKLYFMDSGLLLYLLGFQQWQDVVSNPAWGAIWESMVVASMHNTLCNHLNRNRLYHWRTAAGEEVDLVLETGFKRFMAIECKTAEHVGSEALRGTRAMARYYGDEAVEAAYCVCRTTRPYPLAPQYNATALSLPLALEKITVERRNQRAVARGEG